MSLVINAINKSLQLTFFIDRLTFKRARKLVKCYANFIYWMNVAALVVYPLLRLRCNKQSSCCFLFSMMTQQDRYGEEKPSRLRLFPKQRIAYNK